MISGSLVLLRFTFRFWGCFGPLLECFPGSHSVHVSSLVWSLGVVACEVYIEILLHLVEGFVPLFSAHHSEVFVEYGSLEAFHKTVDLRSLYSCGSVFNIFQL